MTKLFHHVDIFYTPYVVAGVSDFKTFTVDFPIFSGYETGTLTDMHKLFAIYILLKRNVYIIVYILCHTICLQDKDDNNFYLFLSSTILDTVKFNCHNV